jgi:hypothetical protein
MLACNVVDSDPDPAFKVKPDLDTDPDPVSMQSESRVDDQNFKKKTAAIFYIFFFGSKFKFTYPEAFIKYIHPTYRRSLQPSKENIQHLKRLNVFTFFYFTGSFLQCCGSGMFIPDPGSKNSNKREK